MLRDNVLDILRCPQDGSRLACADAELVREINAAIAAGRLRNAAGRTVEQPIDGGLLRAAGDVIYPIVDQIPVLLQDEAIHLDQLDREP